MGRFVPGYKTHRRPSWSAFVDRACIARLKGWVGGIFTFSDAQLCKIYLPANVMATTKALTGGTGDVNPQQLTFTLTQEAADTTVTIEVPLPVPRAFSAKRGKAIVLELLRSEVSYSNIQFPSMPSAQYVVTIGTSSDVDGDEPTVFLTETLDGFMQTAVGFAWVNR